MDLLNILTSFGFPVVACIGMALYVKDQSAENRKEMREVREAHEKEIKEVTTALNNNTLALQRLCDRLEKGEI